MRRGLIAGGLLCVSLAAAAAPLLGSAAACRRYGGVPDTAATIQGWVPGGRFIMGADDAYPEEAPAREIAVAGFWMDRHEVSNAQFAHFVRATGYRTLAERGLDAGRYPTVPARLRQPGSMVFIMPTRLAPDQVNWWHFVPGANWRQPEGPGSSWRGRENHPVVHIAREDAEAYARWAGRSLPTEAEFEYAARGGVDSRFPWGDSLQRQGWQMANTWQGPFPFKNNTEDGFAATAPVGCFAANGYGLFDLIGNVWEWTADDWSTPLLSVTAQPALNLEDALSLQARGSKLGTIKGGSFLCSPLYCQRYRPSARHGQELSLGSSHIGFRTVSHAPGPTVP